ncbi:hypothetical protein E3N88_07522 [Mikania micrantha]|uniref:Protein kinase domain-containing protein n=1 Tax=Mikania micrantha TaxID=192012 RepID=A0A5N6PT58_9ASTR|nr:hypothetical protein E3N88_07522 [Mikania micrantha]
MLIILACFAISNYAVQTDVDCLRSIKESLEDPEQLLSSWDFNNKTEGFICLFTGVECWHPDESRVLNIHLSDMGLRGTFPKGIRSCTSLSGLDLSGNKLRGQIPSNVADVLPFVTTLDLSNNNLSGFAAGLPVSTILTVLLIFCCLPEPTMRRYHLLMIKKIKERQHHLIPRISQAVVGKDNNIEERKVTDWDKYIRALSLMELKMATNDFDTKNVIGYGNMGLMYKAMFQNGILLAVKRLHKFESFEKEFSQEIKILGRLRHTNLVPLMSYCFEMEKKFLIYKYMCNGTLYQWLHSRPQVEGKKMGWTLRLRIAVGIARGLAWLHHNNILRVAHLKISSNCVLLDDKFEPKISNFGNSNLLMSTDSAISSGCNFVVPHSSVDPYKEDVYGFGILLFEIISGKERPFTETDTDSLIYNICSEKCSMIDECLTGQGFDDEIYETLRIADGCIRTHKDGATSMLQVYQAIRAIGISRNEISVDS